MTLVAMVGKDRTDFIFKKVDPSRFVRFRRKTAQNAGKKRENKDEDKLDFCHVCFFYPATITLAEIFGKLLRLAKIKQSNDGFCRSLRSPARSKRFDHLRKLRFYDALTRLIIQDLDSFL